MKYTFILCLLAVSCSVKKVITNSPCSFTQRAWTYEQINDSSARLQLQKLGTQYLLIAVDSCQKIDTRRIHLSGYIYDFDGKEKDGQHKLTDVKIVFAEQKNNILFYKSILTKTDSDGRFKVDLIPNKQNYILVSMKDYNPSAFQIY